MYEKLRWWTGRRYLLNLTKMYLIKILGVITPRLKIRVTFRYRQSINLMHLYGGSQSRELLNLQIVSGETSSLLALFVYYLFTLF